MGVEFVAPLEVYPMSIRATKPALDQEEELRHHVEHFLVAAHELPSLDVSERIDVVERITSFLAEILLPYTKTEQRVLYPAAARLLHERDDSESVGRDRDAVRDLLGRLAEADAHDAGALQECLYALYTLLSSHFWREEALIVKLAALDDEDRVRDVMDEIAAARRRRFSRRTATAATSAAAR
jgi:hemerythrin HHE cation binding domain-containing protein